MGGAKYLHKRRVYGLLHAMYVTTVVFFSTGDILAHISMTTLARLRFARAIGQRLKLVMVALTQNQYSAHYDWFVMKAHV